MNILIVIMSAYFSILLFEKVSEYEKQITAFATLPYNVIYIKTHELASRVGDRAKEQIYTRLGEKHNLISITRLYFNVRKYVNAKEKKSNGKTATG